MSTDRDVAASDADARANKRWLIGIGITLMFGIFGAVMALLSYSRTHANDHRPPAAVAPGAGAPAAVAPAGEAPAPRSRTKNKKKEKDD